MKKIVIYGAGGFGREVKMLVEEINKVNHEWDFLGFVADYGLDKLNDTSELVGGIDFINNFKEELHVVLAVGSPKGLSQMHEKINNPFVIFPNLMHPNVFIHSSNTFGKGIIVMPGCNFTVGIKTGDFNIFNLGACVAHDAIFGDYNILGPNTHISGNITIGNGNLFGVGSIVLEKISIGNYNTIGSASLLTKNAENDATYFGVPAFSLKKKS